MYSVVVTESNLQRNLVVFGRLLRRAGIDVHVGRLIDVTDALQLRRSLARATRSITPAARCSSIVTSSSRSSIARSTRSGRAHVGSQYVGHAARGEKATTALAIRARAMGPAGRDRFRPTSATRRRRSRTRRRGATSRRLADKDFAEFTPDEMHSRAHRARATRVDPRRAPDAAMDSRAAGRASTSGARSRGACAPAATSSRCRRRTAPDQAAAARPAVRRQRLDGTLLAHAAALRACARRAASAASRRFCSRPS